MLFEHQQYQEDCANNIVTVLKDSANLSDFSALQTALNDLQRDQGIPITEHSNRNRLDVLMETGTGKTFTYIKTMYEMNKEYDAKKFIVFVPRTAIREGIIQNIDLTADYFFRQYRKRIKLHLYNKGEMNQIRNFVRNKNELSVLILTSSSINKPTRENSKGNILLRKHENIGRENSTPLDAIAELNPVIFIDEPHLLKGERFTEAYQNHFSKSLCLRFGATFASEENHKISNVIYTLDSLSAFREYLVKRIRVTTIIDGESGVKFSNANVREKSATILYFKDNIEYKKDIRWGDDIGACIGDSNYQGLNIVRTKNNSVYLSNRTTHDLTNNYEISNDTMRRMIGHTIESHFDKEERLFKQGIKTLSLFFIPSVADFRGDAPRIKNMFEEEYKKIRTNYLKKSKLSKSYRTYLAKDYDEDHNLRVHEGYFSGDSGSSDAREARGVELILKKKTELLSVETPLRFIFSVWALQEGWDNPNIFNICKLAPSKAETSRRQQVGRGLRLAVNQQGKRQTHRYCEENEHKFYAINTLDVVVSGQEKDFIAGIQNEIIENSYIFGGDNIDEDIIQGLPLSLNRQQTRKLISFLEDNKIIEFSDLENTYIVRYPVAQFLQTNKDQLPPVLTSKYDAMLSYFGNAAKSPVVNANKKKIQIKIRAEKLEEFKTLWESITRKVKIIYKDIDAAHLKQCIRTRFNIEPIHPAKIIIRKQIYNAQTNEVEISSQDVLGNQQFFEKSTYSEFVFAFAKESKLPLPFIIDMFNQLQDEEGGAGKIKNNPKLAAKLLLDIVKDAIHSNIIHSIGYQFESDVTISNHSPLYDENGKPCTTIDAHHLGRYLDEKTNPPAHYLYDKIVYDSNIEKEVICNDPKKIDTKTIQVFAKLPAISIPTPYKKYHPDFAYFITTETSKKIFLVVETKGYNSEGAIPCEEKQKIEYAKKFFAALQSQIPDVDIVYKSRINQQELHDLLEDINSDR